MLRNIINRISGVKKRTLAFFTMVPLLALTSLITVPCPIDNGTGTLATSPGMENVEISDYYAHEWRITRDSCGQYILYFYDIDISLYNKGDIDAQGWLKLTLVDISKDNRPTVDTQYRSVNIPAGTVMDSFYTVVFGTGLDAYGTTDVIIEVVTGDMPDITCDGSGHVPSNTWLFINSLKNRLTDTVTSQLEYHPPRVIDWSDYTYFDE